MPPKYFPAEVFTLWRRTVYIEIMKNQQCKLTPAQAKEVRRREDLTVAHFAEKFGVSKMTISKIRRGVSYRNLEEK